MLTETFADKQTGSSTPFRLQLIDEVFAEGKYQSILIEKREHSWSSARYIRLWNEIFLLAKDVIDEL